MAFRIAKLPYYSRYHLTSSAGKESTSNAGDPGSIPGSGRSTGERIGYPFQYSWASLLAQMVKNLPSVEETWVQSLGWEAPLEEGLATHSSILAWRIPRTEEPGGLQSTGSHTWAQMRRLSAHAPDIRIPLHPDPPCPRRLSDAAAPLLSLETHPGKCSTHEGRSTAWSVSFSLFHNLMETEFVSGRPIFKDHF